MAYYPEKQVGMLIVDVVTHFNSVSYLRIRYLFYFKGVIYFLGGYEMITYVKKFKEALHVELI